MRSGSNQQSVLFSVRIDARDSTATNWQFKAEWLAEPPSESSRNYIGPTCVTEHTSCFSARARRLFNEVILTRLSDTWHLASDLLSFFMAPQARLTRTAKGVRLKDNGAPW
jgi:hypothetical protein